MSGIYVMAVGPLVADPQARQGTKGPFATVAIRTSGDDAIIVSAIAFNEYAERLLEFVKGDAIAISGRAKLSSWTGRDGTEKHGISVIVEQVASAKPKPRAAKPRRKAAGPWKYPEHPRSNAAPDVAEDRVDDIFPDDGGAP